MSSPYPPNAPYGPPGAAPQPPYGQPGPYGQPVPQGQPAGYGYPAPAPAPYPAPPAPAYGAPQPTTPYDQQPPYGQQPSYGQPGPYGAPMGAPMGAPTGGPGCRICGGLPAVDATVRGHRGLLILIQFRRQYGPFCHTCGTATVRDMSAQTLYQGWWSWGGWAFTLITLLRNLGPHNKFKALPPPAPGTHGPQLDPGKPLTSRPAIFMLGLPLLSIVGFLVLLGIASSVNNDTYKDPYRVSLPSSNSSHTSQNLISGGDCVKNTGTSTDPSLAKVPCSDPTAEFTVLGKLYATQDDTGCKKYPGYTTSFTNEETGNDFVLCMQRKKAAAGTSS